MNNLLKMTVAAAVLALGSALPAMAQVDEGMNFTTSFPFYAGHAKMQAGSYRISQPDMNTSVLLIQSADGRHSAFVDFIPTRSERPHTKSDVTFQQYGDVDFVNRIWIAGERYGVKVDPTKAERKDASAASMVENPISGD